jgi:hypothetical protein
MLFFLSAERQTRLMGAFSSSLAAFETPLRPSLSRCAQRQRENAARRLLLSEQSFYRDLYSRSTAASAEAFCCWADVLLFCN